MRSYVREVTAETKSPHAETKSPYGLVLRPSGPPPPVSRRTLQIQALTCRLCQPGPRRSRPAMEPTLYAPLFRYVGTAHLIQGGPRVQSHRSAPARVVKYGRRTESKTPSLRAGLRPAHSHVVNICDWSSVLSSGAAPFVGRSPSSSCCSEPRTGQGSCGRDEEGFVFRPLVGRRA